MVLIFSEHANRSPQVRREVERALNKGLVIMPCRIENAQPVGAMEYALSNTHWLDVFTPPVKDQLRHLADAVLKLLTANREHARTPTPAMPATTPTGRNTGGATRAIIAAAALALCLLVGVTAWLFVLGGRRNADSRRDGTVQPADPPPSVVGKQEPAVSPGVVGKQEPAVPPTAARRAARGIVTFNGGKTRAFTSLAGLDTSGDVSTPTPTHLFLKEYSGANARNERELRIPLGSIKSLTVGTKWVDIEPYRFMISLDIELRSGTKQSLPACIGCLDIDWSDGIGTTRYMLHGGIDEFLGARIAFE